MNCPVFWKFAKSALFCGPVSVVKRTLAMSEYRLAAFPKAGRRVTDFDEWQGVRHTRDQARIQAPGHSHKYFGIGHIPSQCQRLQTRGADRGRIFPQVIARRRTLRQAAVITAATEIAWSGCWRSGFCELSSLARVRTGKTLAL
jgi:hypothetical protein